ncbi:uncharacterized protein L203_106416 [Cryptococcus depauperatus CBS 7841]|uniref:Aminoglycoside phosphotransferase domain-containing protein n=1 Tax=Cryptococcus depauperatus CBS 7841 TaxID=1295531 RepID=A0A1E3IJ04_9TREE|nr:hypothetical protein L203_02580 [Cryptococcus depauperatus CBS 7841]
MNYEVEQEIVAFFKKTTTTRSACDNYASERLGGYITSVDVQGVCSYTVYAGLDAEFVVQYRLKSLALNMDMMKLANAIYGTLTPQISFEGQIGKDHESREPLCIYVMNRMPGISHLDFILAHNGDVPENSLAFSRWRQNLVADNAKFFALSWKGPQDVDQTYRESLYHQYEQDLNVLLASLPIRFHPLIKKSLDSLPAIFLLPMVLLHNDFGSFNILVDEKTCNLLGVIDWAEAEIAPFGINLYAHDRLISKIHLKHGWSRYDDYRHLDEMFWSTFSQETGVDNVTIKTTKAARIAGALLWLGFTSRLPNGPKPVPISDDDESGAYGMRDLDGLLINPTTRFTDLE